MSRLPKFWMALSIALTMSGPAAFAESSTDASSPSAPVDLDGCVSTCKKSDGTTELSAKCAEFSLKKLALLSDEGISVLLAGTTSACWMACFAPVPPVSTACLVAGVVTDVASIAAIVDLSIEGETWLKATDKAALTLTGAAALADGVEVYKHLASDGEKEGGHESRVIPCTVATLSTALLGLTLNDLTHLPKEIESACREIQDLKSQDSPVIVVALQSPTPTVSPSPNDGLIQVNTDSPSSVSSQNVQTLNGQDGAPPMGGSPPRLEFASKVSSAEDFLNGGTALAATSGPDRQLLDLLPNRSLIPSALVSHGLSIELLAQGLEVSPSVGKIVSLVPDFPVALVPLIHQLEEQIRAGRISARGFSTSDKTKAIAMIQGHRPYSTVIFQRKSQSSSSLDPSQFAIRPDEIPDGVDIWHTNWTGNIFQVVSYRITSVQTDWQKP